MGAAQSYITPETAVATVLVVGAIAFGINQNNNDTPPSSNSNTSPSASNASSKKAKNKNKKSTAVSSTKSLLGETVSRGVDQLASSSSRLLPPPTAVKPVVVPFPKVIPGGFETESSVAEPEPNAFLGATKKGKKKKGKAKGLVVPGKETESSDDSSSVAAPRAAPGGIQGKGKSTPQPVKQRPVKQPSTSIDTDSSWTRVHPNTDSAASASAEVEGSSQVEDEDDDSEEEGARGGRMRPLAERLLPKPRKTGVEDMLTSPQYPTLSREMRISQSQTQKPVSGFTWGDYEDAHGGSSAGGDDDEGEGDWGVVRTKKRQTTPSTNPISSSTAGTSTSPSTLTKKQRQNALKRASEKELKAAAEKERLDSLKRHQRELEKARIAELAKKGGKGGRVSGGMSASVDDTGRLVWS